MNISERKSEKDKSIGYRWGCLGLLAPLFLPLLSLKITFSIKIVLFLVILLVFLVGCYCLCKLCCCKNHALDETYTERLQQTDNNSLHNSNSKKQKISNSSIPLQQAATDNNQKEKKTNKKAEINIITSIVTEPIEPVKEVTTLKSTVLNENNLALPVPVTPFADMSQKISQYPRVSIGISDNQPRVIVSAANTIKPDSWRGIFPGMLAREKIIVPDALHSNFAQKSVKQLLKSNKNNGKGEKIDIVACETGSAKVKELLKELDEKKFSPRRLLLLQAWPSGLAKNVNSLKKLVKQYSDTQFVFVISEKVLNSPTNKYSTTKQVFQWAQKINSQENFNITTIFIEKRGYSTCYQHEGGGLNKVLITHLLDTPFKELKKLAQISALPKKSQRVSQNTVAKTVELFRQQALPTTNDDTEEHKQIKPTTEVTKETSFDSL